MVAKAQRGGRFTRPVLSIDFYWPDRRRRDTLNAVQSIKPYVDGVTDSGAIPDDNWQVLSIGHIRSHLDKTNPRVVLTLAELEGNNEH